MAKDFDDGVLDDFPYFTKRNVIGGFIVICILFVALIMLGSRGQKQRKIAMTKPVLIDQSLSKKRIYSIIQHSQKVEPQPTHTISMTPEKVMKMMHHEEESQQRLQTAGISPISVYDGTVRQDNSSRGESKTTVHHDQPNSLAENHLTSKSHFLALSQKHQQSTITQSVSKPLSHYELKAGAVIPATLLTGINSDLPGKIIAKVRRNVFDTVTGSYLLIPQGTTLIGVYDAQITHGQQRVLIAWQRLLFPNGHSVQLEGQPGVDLAGFAGMRDQVNHHTWQLFGSAMMYSLFSAASQLSQPRTGGNAVSPQQVLFSSTGQQVSQAGAKLASRNLSIQPTLEIRPGTYFNVLLSKDLILQSAYSFDEE